MAQVTDIESKADGLSSKLNWLRAGVLGANDGIVSTAGIVMGVAGAAVSDQALIASGVAGLVAGAISMAVGEYVSVSSQRDTEKAEIDVLRKRLDENPENQRLSLAHTFEREGLSKKTSLAVAAELSDSDAIGAHARYELGINADELTNPWHAAWASMIAFVVGAIIPLIAMVASPDSVRVVATIVAVVIALIITGTTSARLGGAPVGRAIVRVVIGGLAAMLITYAIGALVGVVL
ncbi:VIT family protein [Flaviflexus ciconiae]|uniref:VIT family protein n=1 Tax=Flaviflexus ciconiae TaxID=2496867 RepID=A0A3Q9G314_9ACTO|nr:VIT family protein [Flaviflexus ciconiae]AZQ76553.1 VIT family protein [Flaviflexus ciconiae]